MAIEIEGRQLGDSNGGTKAAAQPQGKPGVTPWGAVTIAGEAGWA
ncbi:MAG: hypothetical protein VKK80_12490 [Prochlorothrix sp.]|nr:hypothetical protein [Prochlorothrix sp.]